MANETDLAASTEAPAAPETLAPTVAAEPEKPAKKPRALKAKTATEKPAKTKADKKTPVRRVAKKTAPSTEEAVAEPTPAKPVRKTRGPAKAAKTADVAKSTRKPKAEKAASPATAEKPNVKAAAKTARATSKAEKPAKAPKVVKTAKTTKATVKAAKATPATPPAKSARVSKASRHTAKELANAAKKAGLIVEFVTASTRTVDIFRSKTLALKIDTITAHLRGANGDLIRERGPGTPHYGSKDTTAAADIFSEFRDRTFHKGIKIAIQ